MLRGMMRGRSPPRYALCAEPEKQNMKKEKAGRERACRRMQALFSSGFCAINPISGSKKNGFFQSGGHGAAIPRRRHRRDSVYLGRH